MRLHFTRIFQAEGSGDDDVKSSVRSAMFIATRAAVAAKLRRSGVFSWLVGVRRQRVGARGPSNAAPTEHGRAHGPVAAINMALLTELNQPLLLEDDVAPYTHFSGRGERRQRREKLR